MKLYSQECHTMYMLLYTSHYSLLIHLHTKRPSREPSFPHQPRVIDLHPFHVPDLCPSRLFPGLQSHEPYTLASRQTLGLFRSDVCLDAVGCPFASYERRKTSLLRPMLWFLERLQRRSRLLHLLRGLYHVPYSCSRLMSRMLAPMVSPSCVEVGDSVCIDGGRL